MSHRSRFVSTSWTPTTTSITHYFSYFETARIDYLTEMGWGLDRLKEQGWQLVVVDLNARFSAAARFGEELIILTWIEEVGRVKSTWRQVMLRAGEEVARLTVSALSPTSPASRGESHSSSPTTSGG